MKNKLLVTHLLQNAEQLLAEWLPDGELQGDEWVSKNPMRPDDTNPGSFKINIVSGKWSDFALGDDAKGNDLLSLYKYLNPSKPDALISRLLTKLMFSAKPKPKKKKISLPEPEPLGAMALASIDEFPLATPNGNIINCKWPYKNTKGEIIFWMVRADPPGEDKEIRPVYWDASLSEYVWKMPVKESYLYNVDKIIKGSQVVWSEGEKCATKLEILYPDSVSVTTRGGVSALSKTNFAQLDLAISAIIFPDADDNKDVGALYASRVAILCHLKGLNVSILDITRLGWSAGQDVADFDYDRDVYAEHLLSWDDWLDTLSPKALANLVITVCSILDKVDYGQCRKSAAKLAGVAVALLDSAVLKLRKPEVTDADNGREPDWYDKSVEEAAETRASLFTLVEPLATRKDIFTEVLNVIQKDLGLSGESANVKGVYLVAISRLLVGTRPASLFLKGTQASGKTYIIKRVLHLFEQYFAWLEENGGSDKAFVYDNKPLKHRIIFYPEADMLGDANHFITQVMKVMISENKFLYKVTVKNEESGQYETIEIIKEGPISVMCSTALQNLNPDLETRAITLHADESKEQTVRVLAGRAVSVSGREIVDSEAITARVQMFQDFDKWLSLHPTRQVVVPYFSAIVDALVDPPVIFRRYVCESLLALIQASALMHHYHRVETEQGYIVANIEDYGHAYDVTCEVFRRELGGSAPSPTQQRIFEWVDEQLQKSKDPVIRTSSREISIAIGVAGSTIKDNIKTMVSQGLLENSEIARGKPYKLKLGKAGEVGVVAGLIAPAKLAELL